MKNGPVLFSQQKDGERVTKALTECCVDKDFCKKVDIDVVKNG